MNAGPYANLRVLECGNGTGCAFAGQILADKGAEVIKVEPRQGDDLRWRDPHRSGESKTFQWLCRGKRSIIVDDNTEAGRAVLARLAGAVDIVLTNWPQSPLTKAGLDPDALLTANPRLIVLSCSRFGASGEWAERPANDLVLQAFSGLTVAEGKRRDDGTPDAIRCSEITQFSAGLAMAIGIGAALYHRERSGRGQIVRTSELGTALLMHCWRIGRNGPAGTSADADQRQLAQGRARGASHGELAAPLGPARDPVSIAGRCFYRAYVTADGGAVFLGAQSRPMRDRARKAWGTDFLLRDDPNHDPQDPELQARCVEFVDQVVRDMGSRATAEWLETLEQCGVPSGEVACPEDVGAREQVRVNGYVVDIDHPLDGHQLQVAPLARFGCCPDPDLRPSPRLGEHTSEILDADV